MSAIRWRSGWSIRRPVAASIGESHSIARANAVSRCGSWSVIGAMVVGRWLHGGERTGGAIDRAPEHLLIPLDLGREQHPGLERVRGLVDRGTPRVVGHDHMHALFGRRVQRNAQGVCRSANRPATAEAMRWRTGAEGGGRFGRVERGRRFVAHTRHSDSFTTTSIALSGPRVQWQERVACREANQPNPPDHVAMRWRRWMIGRQVAPEGGDVRTMAARVGGTATRR